MLGTRGLNLSFKVANYERMRNPCKIVQSTKVSEQDWVPEVGPSTKAHTHKKRNKQKPLVLFCFVVLFLKMPEAGYFIRDNFPQA